MLNKNCCLHHYIYFDQKNQFVAVKQEKIFYPVGLFWNKNFSIFFKS